MRDELVQAIADAAKKLFNVDVESELTRPEEKFGDYATNAALQLAAKTGDNPRQNAEEIAEELRALDYIESVDVAGPGFINFRLTNEGLAKAAANATSLPQLKAGQEVLVEYGNFNPFKEMHIGHLYTAVVGEAIARLSEADGAEVKRLSYHGDVGPHVAKAVWAIQKDGGEIKKDLGDYYSEGSRAYKVDESAAAEIRDINKKIYDKSDPTINKIYEEGIKLSFANYDRLFEILDIKHDKRYLESQTFEAGKKIVKDNIGRVFEESQGAIIFDGEKRGLHTRVFLNSEGLPTYEAKDLGLVEIKNRDFPEASSSIIITDSQQTEYFRVMLAALAEIQPDLAKKTVHLSHGFLSLTSGKMSSRLGNVVTTEELLETIKDTVNNLYPNTPNKEAIYLGAVKYAFIKHRLGQDIVVDPNEAASLEGNSGPYLQYAHARACSILAKATVDPKNLADLEKGERSLAGKISEFPEVVELAAAELMPHYICTYLYELSQAFNRFYENNRVIDDPRQEHRLWLVDKYVSILKQGLNLLGIEAPERM